MTTDAPEHLDPVEPLEPTAPSDHTAPVPAGPAARAEDVRDVRDHPADRPADRTLLAPATALPAARRRTPRAGVPWPAVTAIVAVTALAASAVGAGVATRLDRRPAPAAPAATAASLADAGLASLRSPRDIQTLVQAASPGVVAIRTGSATDEGLFARPDAGGGAGTGFVIDPAGIIVTNNHVVASDPAQLEVVTSDGAMYQARILGRAPALDLAVLSIKPQAPLTALRWGVSSALQPGDDVVAIGNALGLDGELSVTRGIISATGRTVDTDADTQLLDMLQTDTAINPGNSGGPLLDAAGQVIGINTAIANPGQAQNIGFAIAADAARPAIAQLQAGDTVTLAYLGVHSSTATPADRALLGTATSGAKLADVMAGGPSRGVLFAGDIITALGDTPVRSAAGLGAAVRRYRPGDVVTVHLRRGGEPRTEKVTLGATRVETLR